MSPLILDYPRNRRRPLSGKQRPFTLSAAKVQDVRRLVDIEFHAFENEQVNQVLSYRDYKKPAHFERSVKLYETALNKDTYGNGAKQAWEGCSADRSQGPSQKDSHVSFRKITDIEMDEVVSFAKVEVKTYTLEELEEPLDVGHEGEPKMNCDWFALNERLRREYIGLTRHCYIGMLATLPKHQHNGAGTMLLEDILAEADDEGLEVYLEATDTAKPLYEKHGFEAITELRFDPAEYGVKGLGVERQTVMVRGAIGQDGERKAVRSWDVATADAILQLQERNGKA